MNKFVILNEILSISENFLGMKGISSHRFSEIFKKSILQVLKIRDENDLVAQKLKEVSAKRIARLLVNQARVGQEFIIILAGAGSTSSRQRNIFIISNIYDFIKRINSSAEHGEPQTTAYILTDLRTKNSENFMQIGMNTNDLVDAMKSFAEHRLIAYNISVKSELRDRVPIHLLDLEDAMTHELDKDDNIEDNLKNVAYSEVDDELNNSEEDKDDSNRR